MDPGALCPLSLYSPDPLSVCLPAAQETCPLQARNSHQKEKGGFLCPPPLGTVHSFIPQSSLEHLGASLGAEAAAVNKVPILVELGASGGLRQEIREQKDI